MGPLKKICCRGFQTVFRLALPFLPYRDPKILRCLGDVPPLLKGKNIRRVLLVTDKNLRKIGGTAPLEEALEEAGLFCAVYDETVANPTVANAEAARQKYLDNGCEAVIAFGGGSPMDCAKALCARIARPDRSLLRMKGLLKVRRATPLLIAVPTTAGSGSETTLAAVITDEQSHHKYVINDFALIPSYAVLDPAVTATLPKAVAAATGMDALTHAAEAFIGRSTTKETRADALKAVELIFQHLEKACEGEEEARKQMLYASYLAGKAFTRSYVGYVHAVAHSLGGAYGTPHGEANAILLPHVLRAYGEDCEHKLALLADAAGIGGSGEKEKAAAFIEAIEAMNRRLGIPDVIGALKEEDIPALARTADQEANPLYPVPRLMDAKELESLYRAVLK
ncbi:MAG: iron-containing alcohol dehydrogenase [Clostridia bacterium]